MMRRTYEVKAGDCVCQVWDRNVPEIRATPHRHHRGCRMVQILAGLRDGQGVSLGAVAGRTPAEVLEGL